MERNEVKIILDKLKVVFEKLDNSEQSLNVWAELLKPFESKYVWFAAKTVMETCTFAPKPADLIKIIREKMASRGSRNYFNCSPEERAKYDSELEARGIVKTPTGYERLENTVELDGKRLSKLEFCMDVLGASHVEAMIREQLNIYSFMGFDTKKYNNFLDNVLVPMAMNDIETGYFVEK